MKISIFITKHWDALLASVAGCIFIYLFTRHSGIGISPDSVSYESTATNIRNHFSFTDFNGVPLVDFPLGYPSLLALVSFITGKTVLQIAPLLNGILFSGLIILTSIIIEGYKKTSAFYKACILALIACSPFLLEIYSMLWSETWFLFLIVLFIVAINRYFKSYNLTGLFFAAIIAALAFVTRYAGITVIATGLILIFFNDDIPLAKKIKHLIIFGVTASSLAFINLVRNSRVAGHATGVREKALRTLSDNFQQAGSVLTEWLPFLKGQETLATFIFIVLITAAVIILIYHIIQQQYFQSYETAVAGFFIVYCFFLLTIATISRFENLSSRLLSPVYIPLLLTGSSWIVPLLQRSVRVKRIIIVTLTLIVYAGFHIHHYRLNAEAWEGIKDSGMPGYAEGSWRDSPAVAFVKKNKDRFTQPIYANANDAVYFLTGIHAMALPHKEIEKEKEAMLKHPSFYLIWFKDGENTDLVGLDFIRQYKQQVSVEEVEGGAVYFFSSGKNN